MKNTENPTTTAPNHEEDNRVYSASGIDITPNVNYRYKEPHFEDEDEGTSYKFSQKDFMMCNVFFESLHIHKVVENGNFQEPVWNFVVPSPTGDTHADIKIPHLNAFSALKVMRAFQGVGFTGFPKIFAKSKTSFLWDKFMDYVVEAFRTPEVIEEEPIDSAVETFICKLCELPFKDEEDFYSSNDLIGSVFNREGQLCLNIKTTTVDKIIVENKIQTISSKFAAKLNEKKFKLRKTWQHGGGVRIWSFPIEKLEPFGFKINTKQKINHDSMVVSNMGEVFSFKPKAKKVEIIDGNTGESRGEL